MNLSSRFNPVPFRPQLVETFVLSLLCLLAMMLPTGAQTRIKDVATVEGARDNQLVGYGIVAGLDGQGDSDKLFTQQTIANMARKFGVHVLPTDITNKNVALVMVTATVPPFTRQGTKLSVNVASLADAKSLQGGILLQTPLVAGDGQVYAVAQGSVFLGGFDAGAGGAGGATVTKNHTTSGVITNGALVENEIPTSVFSKGILEIVLRQGDFTSAVRMANAINEQIGHIADAVSPTTVQVFVPKEMQAPERQMEFVARIENASFVPDVAARIVINERTGAVVANANIQIAKVAVAYGSLTVSVTNSQAVSQPEGYVDNSVNIGGKGGNGGAAGPGGRGGNASNNSGVKTEVTSQTTTNVQEEKRAIVVFKEMATVEDVAFALNSLGATPRELMSILQSIKDAGALNAELVLE